MPELPEVETICNTLIKGNERQPSILNGVIIRAKVLWDRTIAEPSVDEYIHQVVGQSVKDVGRRGKFILLQLTHDWLAIHLRMSGDLLVEKRDLELAPHHRVILDFKNGYRLAFNDPRKFGRIWLVEDLDRVTGHLGPEPFDIHLTPEFFHDRLHRFQRRLKPLLMDQTFIAGLGNIYTDEALNLACLNPLYLSSDLSYSQSEKLLSSIRQVLERGIEFNGASIDWVYRGGNFQNYFRVYQRVGEPCPNCGTPIIKIIVGQRGTHLCPTCQPFPES